MVICKYMGNIETSQLLRMQTLTCPATLPDSARTTLAILFSLKNIQALIHLVQR